VLKCCPDTILTGFSVFSVLDTGLHPAAMRAKRQHQQNFRALLNTKTVDNFPKLRYNEVTNLNHMAQENSPTVFESN